MTKAEQAKLIRDIIADNKLTLLFHPILSVKRRGVIGVEALPEANSPDGPVSYAALHDMAAVEGLTLDLDRALRQKALEGFQSLHQRDKDLLLFLRFETSVVDLGIVGSGHLANVVSGLGINPNNVVIEITDSEASDTGALKKFVGRYHDAGFLIALRDVGSGHSNLTRIAQTRPDILKFNPTMARGLAKEYYRREIMKALFGLSKNLGVLAVPEGIDNEDDAVLALELGADMLEGSYISAQFPHDAVDRNVMDGRIDGLVEKLKASSLQKSASAKSRFQEQQKTFAEILGALAKSPAGTHAQALAELAAKHSAAECMYLLDEAGVQISDTVSAPGKLLQQRKLFRPAEKGADHSSKDYYYLLIDTFISNFTTEPYVSMASGNLCVTISGMMRGAGTQRTVLCVDFPVGE